MEKEQFLKQFGCNEKHYSELNKRSQEDTKVCNLCHKNGDYETVKKYLSLNSSNKRLVQSMIDSMIDISKVGRVLKRQGNTIHVKF